MLVECSLPETESPSRDRKAERDLDSSDPATSLLSTPILAVPKLMCFLCYLISIGLDCLDCICRVPVDPALPSPPLQSPLLAALVKVRLHSIVDHTAMRLHIADVQGII